MEENHQNKALLWKISTALLAVSTGVLGYLLLESKGLSQQQQSTISQKVQEVSVAKISLDSIGSQLDARIAETKSLGGRVEELEALKKQLEADKKGLSELNTFTKQQYENKIAGYIGFLTTKEIELTHLRKENTLLAEKNRAFASQNTNLTNDNLTLRLQQQVLNDSLDALSRRNTDLSEKVNRAAALQAESIRVLAISDKGKERHNSHYKASKVEKLKITFTLAHNPIAQQNTKTLFLRIIDPDGAALFDTNAGSGKFEIFGQNSYYTVKKAVFFQNNGQGVEMLYHRDSAMPYRTGRYKVELYAEGFKIGESGFSIK